MLVTWNSCIKVNKLSIFKWTFLMPSANRPILDDKMRFSIYSSIFSLNSWPTNKMYWVTWRQEQVPSIAGSARITSLPKMLRFVSIILSRMSSCLLLITIWSLSYAYVLIISWLITIWSITQTFSLIYLVPHMNSEKEMCIRKKLKWKKNVKKKLSNMPY